MNEQQKNKRYVAHFDMLGFKSAILRNPAFAWGALNDLRVSMDRMLNLHIKIVSTDEIISNRIKAYIFSDSILIFSLSDEPQDLISILTLTSELFSGALHRCIPLRGGVAYGDFFFNLDLHLFCGVPFVKAHELSEISQWSGIIIDDSVAEHYRKNIDIMPHTTDPIIIQWNVPIKNNNKKQFWVVNWPDIFRNNFTKKFPISVLDYYEGFKSLFGPYEDLSTDVKIKYVNTVSFINSNFCHTAHFSKN